MNQIDRGPVSKYTGETMERIDSLVSLMKRIDSPDSRLTPEFHAELSDIDTLSKHCPDDRESLLAYCLEKTATELSQSEIHRHGREKPFGYAGDFQVIDWTYSKSNKSPGRGALWDDFYHLQDAPLAVCDRKDRFGRVLTEVSKQFDCRPIRVLNVASGPCRELLDGASAAGMSPGQLDVLCVDTDSHAIDYAKSVLGEDWERSVKFHHGNAIRFRPPETYELIWCAGLYDYLDHRLAVLLTRKLWKALAPGGSLIIGNFSTTHRTRPWIEWCGSWFLIHRSEMDFESIACDAGIPQSCFSQELDRWQAIRFFIAKKLGE